MTVNVEKSDLNNPIRVENPYKGLDYNLLNNIPTVDGKEVKGDMTTEQLIGFDKDYVDETVTSGGATLVQQHNADEAAHPYILQKFESYASKDYADNSVDIGIQEHNISSSAHQDIRNAIETLQFLKLVETLPDTGDTKYIYAVPQDERTIDGELIVLLNIWTGTEWAAVGATSTSGDLTEYLKKSEAASTYLNKTTGGLLSGQLFTNSYISFNTSGRGIIFPGGGQVNGFNTGNIFLQNANNGLIFRQSDKQLVRRKDNVDSIILTEAEKAVANGIASLDSTGKVPQSQLPISFSYDEESQTLNITTAG